MARFVRLYDPQGATGKTIDILDTDITSYLMQNVTDFCVENYDVYLNGDELQFPTVKNDVVLDEGSSELFKVLKPTDEVIIVNNPKGAEVLIFAAVAAVAAAAVVLLQAPVTPNDQGRQIQSSNNTLSGQTNIARAYQAIPDIYGSPVSYPDLAAEAAQEFVQRGGESQQVLTQLMTIGIGEVDVDEVRTSDTPLFNAGGSFAVYQPVNGESVVPSVTETFSINEIDGQLLSSSGSITSGHFLRKGITSGVTMRFQALPVFGSFIRSFTIDGLDLRPFLTNTSDSGFGVAFSVSGVDQVTGDVVSFTTDSTLTGVASVTATRAVINEFFVISNTPDLNINVTDISVIGNIGEISQNDTVDGNDSITTSPFNLTIIPGELVNNRRSYEMVLTYGGGTPGYFDYSGGSVTTFDVTANSTNLSLTSTSNNTTLITSRGGNTESRLTFSFDAPESTTIPTLVDASVTDMSFSITKDETVGPFSTSVPADNIWVDIAMPRGSQAVVELDITYYPISETGQRTGPNVVSSQTIADQNTFTSRFFTFKIDTGMNSRYAVSVRRTNSESADVGTPSEARLQRVAAVRQITNQNFGNVTMLQVTIPSTVQATSLRESQINCDIRRKTIGYNRTTDMVDMTLRRSRSFADAILHEWVVVFEQDASNLALEELYDIADGLDDPRLGYFDYTFDDLDVSLGERLRTMANCARVYAYQENGVWRFKRDELQETPSTVLTRRDIAKNRTFSVTNKRTIGDSKDSVQVEYVDPITNKNAYIQRMVSNGQIVEGVGINPLKVEMPFCREEFNAINRAELEMRKLLYLRTFVKDTFLAQGHGVELGDKVMYERVFDMDDISGEILSIDGNNVRLSEPVTFTPGEQLFIQFTDNNGNASNRFTITDNTSSSDPRDVVLQSTASADNPYVADGIMQRRGSVYILGSNLDDAEYIVQSKKPNQDGRRVNLELAKADDRVYEFDSFEPYTLEQTISLIAASEVSDIHVDDSNRLVVLSREGRLIRYDRGASTPSLQIFLRTNTDLQSVDTDNSDNIYVLDIGAGTNGQFSQYNQNLDFVGETDLATGSANKMAVNSLANIVVLHSALNSYETYITDTPINSALPNANWDNITIDRNDNIYFLDDTNNRILVYTSERVLNRTITLPSGDWQDLAVGMDDRIYLLDRGADLFRVIDANGNLFRQQPLPARNWNSIAVNNLNEVYVADAPTDTVLRYALRTQ